MILEGKDSSFQKLHKAYETNMVRKQGENGHTTG
jgi:hypothetical protein